jgi:UDP-N-acetylglucosamine:LPS N-acetylglucosamine transferase
MSGKKILISPLNWGFGHAGRMIPLALELKKRGNEIVFAAEKYLLPLIEKDLPDITFVSIPGLRIRYSGFLPQYLFIFLQVPLIISSALREHALLKHLVRRLKPDIIISDNRFGFWHREVFSVYVTHQLRIPLPCLLGFLEPLAVLLHRMIISNYDLCLVPDLPGKENLSGRLSHDVKLPGNVLYTGPLSRFNTTEPSSCNKKPENPYYCLILSGPEPQRTLLLEKTVAALPGCRLVIMGRSRTGYSIKSNPDLTFITNPGTETMRQTISASGMVITRAGYTSIMELVSLGKGAILGPTPGQTEQEYLGQHLNGRYGLLSLKQKQISNLNALIKRQQETAVPQFPSGKKLFDEALTILSEQQKKRDCHHSCSGKQSQPNLCR